MDYDSYCEVFDIPEDYYSKDKWNRMQNNFSLWFCELDNSSAERFINHCLKAEGEECKLVAKNSKLLSLLKRRNKMSTLIIENVNFELLEKQRVALGATIYQPGLVNPEVASLIHGLLNMLDAWSDSEYYKKSKEYYEKIKRIKAMENKTIEIKKAEVVAEFLSNLKHVGSSDWSIYANQDGDVDTRHNTENLYGWAKITGFYSAWENLENDSETADWLTKDGFDWPRISQDMEEGLKLNSDWVEDEDGSPGFQEFEVNFI